MPHKQYIHRPTVIKDLIIITVINLGFFIAFVQVDFLEWLYHFSRKNEHLELDEFFPLGITIALSLLVFSYRRIKELGLMAKTLEQMSLVDPLTGLPNRRAGQIRLIRWCLKAERKAKTFVVYQIDIDQFKKVNDMFGQIIGDDVLKLAARVLNQMLPSSSLLCRWLDDNFLLVVPLKELENPHLYAHEIQQTINQEVMASTLKLTTCIGYKIWQKGQGVEDLLHDADDALMHAKQSGRNQIKGN